MPPLELKPCPFCGRKLEHYNIEYTGVFTRKFEADCDYCHAHIEIEPPRIYAFCEGKDAIDTWNRRENQQF